MQYKAHDDDRAAAMWARLSSGLAYLDQEFPAGMPIGRVSLPKPSVETWSHRKLLTDRRAGLRQWKTEAKRSLEHNRRLKPPLNKRGRNTLADAGQCPLKQVWTESVGRTHERLENSG